MSLAVPGRTRRPLGAPGGQSTRPAATRLAAKVSADARPKRLVGLVAEPSPDTLTGALTVAPVTHPIRHLVPLDNEIGWSDLLAALIEIDPAPVADALALGPVQHGDVQVRRETASHADPAGRRRDRIDLLVDVHGTLRAALEVKVLSGLGRAQLKRYRESYPGADRYVLVAPAQFPLPEQDNPGWEQQSWESLIGALATSEQLWVRATAQAWLEHLSSALPRLTPRTRWDDLHAGDPFPLMLRARVAWVHQHLQAQEGVTTQLVQATGSNKWVTRVHADCVAAGYRVVAEVEDATPVRSKQRFPKVMSETTPPPTGPEFRVFLEQVGVDTSAGFSWAYLHAMWPLMASAQRLVDRERAQPAGAARQGRARCHRRCRSARTPRIWVRGEANPVEPLVHVRREIAPASEQHASTGHRNSRRARYARACDGRDTDA